MTQLTLILNRLKRPSVLLSITSQIITLLVLYDIDIDTDMITATVTSLTSILVLLGILSNPDSQTMGYRDDIAPCQNCGSETQQVFINGEFVCKNCGTPQTPALSIDETISQ